MLVKTRDNKEQAYRDVINWWLKSDPDNIQICRAVILQNRERKAKMRDMYGSSKDYPKDLRAGLSLPPGLYFMLLHFERMHGRKFMDTKEDFYWFAKKFPQFCIMERI